MSVKQAPFGSWKSPISSAIIARGGIRLQDLKISKNSDTGIIY